MVLSMGGTPGVLSEELVTSSFFNLSFTSPTSQLILQPFHRITYVTAHSPILPLLYQRHSSFSNPSFASPTSQALHSMHLANRPWKEPLWRVSIPGIYRIPNLHDYPSSHSTIVAAVEDGGSYSSTRRLWSAVYDKVCECTEHSADRNSSSAVPGLWPHTARRLKHLLQEFGWEVFNHHPP